MTRTPPNPLRVLEWVRSPIGMWNVPHDSLRQLAADIERVAPVEIRSPATREEADALLPETDVVLGFAVRPANFARASRLRWIHCTAASVHGVLFPELVASDVLVTNARGLHAESMAEHALAMMLAFTRKLHVARDAQHMRQWTQVQIWEQTPPIGALAGATLGLVGLGTIGSAIAVRAKALGMHVIALRVHPAPAPAPADAQLHVSRLREVLPKLDWLVLVAPHTRETTRLIGREELALMKPTARLVNLGRGALVDEAALIEALRTHRLAGAALDVFEEEPLPETSPLWDLPEVIVTPHTSGLGPGYWERAMAQFKYNLKCFVAGEPLMNVVDKQAGY
jgi:phosphoglycerate dehydrogenase-like enzyme